jgi:ComEC/Rec2-related protein
VLLISAAIGWLLACTAFAFGLAVAPILPLSATLAALLPSRSARHRCGHVAASLLATLAGVLLLHQHSPASNSIAARAGSDVTVMGRALTDGDPHPTYTTLTFAVQSVDEAGVARSASGTLLVYLPALPAAPNGTIHAGDRLRLRGQLEAPATAARNDGYAAYLERQGIAAVLAYPQETFLARPAENPLLATLRTVRERTQQGLAAVLPPREAALASAAVFGNRHALPKDLADDLLVTGTTHVATFSAFNALLLYGAALGLLAPLLGRRKAAVLALGTAFAYAMLSGAGVAGWRGEAIAAVLTLATVSGRPYSATAALLLVAAALCLSDPLLPADAGFQLTFSAAAGIAVVAPWLQRRFAGDEDGESRPWRDAVCFGVGVSLAVTPAAAAAGGASIVSPLANALLYPLLAPLTVLAALTGALASVSVTFAPLYVFTRGIELLTHVLATAPGAATAWRGTGLIPTAAWYATLLLVSRLLVVVQRHFARRSRHTAPRPASRLPLPAPIVGTAVLLLFVAAQPALALVAPDHAAVTNVRWLALGKRPAALLTGRNGLRVLLASASEPAALAQAVEAATGDGRGVDVLVAENDPTDAALQSARGLNAAELILPRSSSDGAGSTDGATQIVALRGSATLDMGGGDSATIVAATRGEAVVVEAGGSRALLVLDDRGLADLPLPDRSSPFAVVVLPPLDGGQLRTAFAGVRGETLLLAGGWTDADATIARATWPGARVAAAAPGTRLDFAHGATRLSTR